MLTEPHGTAVTWLIYVHTSQDDDMMSAFFPIAFTAVFALLLTNTFRMMRKPGSTTPINARTKDRTGLQTIHPELLDENGNLTQEDLYIIRFPGKV